MLKNSYSITKNGRNTKQFKTNIIKWKPQKTIKWFLYYRFIIINDKFLNNSIILKLWQENGSK